MVEKKRSNNIIGRSSRTNRFEETGTIGNKRPVNYETQAVNFQTCVDEPNSEEATQNNGG